LQRVFFSACRTVSRLTDVTSPRRFSSSASRCSVHRVRPVGAVEQHVATRYASAFPSIFAGVGGVARTFRFNAGYSPSQTNRFRNRSTVFTCIPNASAIRPRVSRPPARPPSLSNSTRA
jgi:hypothetical protein